MKGKKEKNMKKAGFRMGLVSMLVIGIMVGYMTLPTPVLEQDVETGSWHVIWEGNLASAAENATISVAGANVSGILSVYFHPHQTDGGSYMENSSSNLETNCTDAGLGFANEEAVEVDLAHSTTFDLVVRVQGNNSNCKVGGVFYDTNLKVQWTCADLGVAGDTELTHAAGEAKTTGNDTTYTYLYMNFFDNNADAGFTISQDQTVEITSIKFLAYY